MIANEHPQTIALVLAYLPADTAAQVVSALPDELQADVAMRIALMDRTAPEVIREIERVLERKLSSVITQDFTSAGGLRSLVDLLNQVDRTTERTILETLEEQNPELADEVRRMMFLFEDIIGARRPQHPAGAARGGHQGARDRPQGRRATRSRTRSSRNMSERAAAIIKEELEFMGPVRVKQVEEAQQKVVAVIRRLEEAGKIVIIRGGEDQLVA